MVRHGILFGNHTRLARKEIIRYRFANVFKDCRLLMKGNQNMSHTNNAGVEYYKNCARHARISAAQFDSAGRVDQANVCRARAIRYALLAKMARLGSIVS